MRNSLLIIIFVTVISYSCNDDEKISTDSTLLEIQTETEWKSKNGPPIDYINKFDMSGDKIVLGPARNIYVSTDRGLNWTKTNFNLPYGCLSISDNMILVGTLDKGIYRSLDDGHSWEEVNNGIVIDQILSLEINNEFILAGTYGTSYEGSLYISYNNGDNWFSLNTNNDLQDMFSVATNGNDIFAGAGYARVFNSKSNDWKWSSAVVGSSAVGIVNAIEMEDNKIVAGIDKSGVFISFNKENDSG